MARLGYWWGQYAGRHVTFVRRGHAHIGWCWHPGIPAVGMPTVYGGTRPLKPGAHLGCNRSAHCNNQVYLLGAQLSLIAFTLLFMVSWDHWNVATSGHAVWSAIWQYWRPLWRCVRMVKARCLWRRGCLGCFRNFRCPGWHLSNHRRWPGQRGRAIQ